MTDTSSAAVVGTDVLSELEALQAENRELRAALAAGIGILQVMSDSLNDAQPAFALIARHARELCGATGVALTEYDGNLLHLRVIDGADPAESDALRHSYPRPPAADFIAGRAVLSGELCHFHDVMIEPDLARFVREMGFRSAIGVPLRRGGQTVGALVLSRVQSGGFNEGEIALIRSFADQAVIALSSAAALAELRERTAELARRNSEYGERIEQQSATIDVLKVMSASPGDATPVFELIVESARSFCEADMVSLALAVDGAIHLQAYRGLSREHAATYAASFPRPIGTDTVFGRTILARDVQQVPDNASDPSFALAESARTYGFRSHAGVPLLQGGEAIGALVIARKAPGDCTPAQMELLRTFAEQAVIAIGSADTYRALQARTKALAERNTAYREQITHQSATIDVLKAMSASPSDAQPVFDLIVQRAAEVCNAPNAVLFRYDGELAHWQATTGAETYASPEAFEAIKRRFPMAPNRASLVGRCILDRSMVHIRDVETEPEIYQALRDLNTRSLLSVPLLRDGVVLGVLGLSAREAGGFSNSQVALLETFAEQAVIAMVSAGTFQELQERTAELARRNSEYGERIEHQSAAIDVLKAMSASPGDTRPVFNLIVRHTLHACNGMSAALFEYDGELVHPRAGVGGDIEAIAAFEATFPRPATREFLVGRAILDRQTVHVRDIDAEPGVLPAVRAMGGRTTLSMPLLRDGVAIGAISLNARDPGGFSDSQIALLQTFAEQAVIAIGSAETYRALQERTAALAQRNNEYGERIEHQAATIDVLKAMSGSPDATQTVFDLITSRARQLCNGTVVAVFEFDGELLHVRSSAFSDFDPAIIDAVHAMYPMPPAHTTVAGRAILERQIIHVRDSDAEAGLAPVIRDNVKSILGVPLIQDGAAIGVITLVTKEPGGLSDGQVALIRTFAEQAVIAISSAETYRALKERTAALAQRNSEYGERIEQQSATIDVLKAMSSSPGDAQPVFELIARRALELCGATGARLTEFDGELRHLRALARADGMETDADAAVRALYPAPLDAGSMDGRVILYGSIVHARDPGEVPPRMRGRYQGSVVGVPLLREGRVAGAIVLSRAEPGGFSDTQVGLLQTFAEQAVIAIGSAATYRALQERTAALARRNSEYGERIEQQAATIDVLKAMSDSPGDTRPVFEAIIRRATDLCESRGGLFEFDGTAFYLRALYGFDPHVSGAFASRFPVSLEQGRRNSFGRAVLERRVIHIPDMHADPDISQSPLAQMLEGRSIVAVPLLRDGQPIGVIGLNGNPQGGTGFSDSQIALLQTFAEQAVIAIGSAETYRALQERTAALAQRNSEYSERIEQQEATIDVLKTMSASPGDTRPVFDLIVQRAAELCDAQMASLALFDGTMMHLATHSGLDADGGGSYAAQFPRRAGTDSTLGRAILSRQMVQIEDLAADPLYVMPRRRNASRSTMAQPLLHDGAPIGAILIGRQQPGPFSDSQAALLQIFAGQAVIAIASANTYRSLQERTDELSRSVNELQALEEVLRAVNSSLDLETVLATIISRAVQLSRSDEGTIYEFNAAEEVFVPRSAYGMSAERVALLRDRRLRLGETHLGRSAVLRAPVSIDDVQQDASVPNAAEALPGIHAVLAVPLLREDTVVGGLVIRRRSQESFTPQLVTLMQTFAGQAVLAIENARLFQEAGRARIAAEAALADLRRAQDRLVQSEKMASLGQLTAGIAHEIKNPLNFVNNFSDLSRDLLDELADAVADGQQAEIAELSATLKGNLEKIAEHGRRADSIVRNMLLHSRSGPGEQRAVDLNAVVEEALNLAYHGARAETPGFNITLVKDLDPSVGLVELYPQEFTRVMVNLINNGFYAASKRAGIAGFEPTLRLATSDRGAEVEIRVRDNGVGIDPAVQQRIFEPFFTTKPAGEGTGLGLSLSYDIIVKQHGGRLTVNSAVNDFTEFVISLPRPIAANDGGRA